MKKRFNSPIYTQGKFGKRYRETLDIDNVYLYSHGIYPTKIKREDLPEDYIEIQSRVIWYMKGYLKTAGIVDMKYKWCKINHLFKDDYLYISYYEPLQIKEQYNGYATVVNADVCICGNSIIPVLLAAEKYSSFNISVIRQQIEEKKLWYKEHCYEDYVRQFGEKDVDLFELYS